MSNSNTVAVYAGGISGVLKLEGEVMAAGDSDVMMAGAIEDLPVISAGVHDALWILTQQWRVGEFRGEDAGTLIKAKIETRSTRLNRFKSRDGAVEAFNNDVPLEAKVERLPLLLDLGMQLEIGKQWYRILKERGLASQYQFYLDQFPIDDGSSSTDVRLKSDINSMTLRGAMHGVIVNGGALFNHVYVSGNTTYSNITNLPTPATTAMISAHADFDRWMKNTYDWPEKNTDISWSDRQLEYQFSLSSPTSNSSTASQDVFRGDQYMSGTVDWYSVDRDSTSGAKLQETGTPISNDVIDPSKVRSYLPSPIDFKGMPKGRWWEFEDRNIDIARMMTQRQDLAKMILMEFGLNYSNDWFIIPHEVDNGTVTEALGLVATDVFGKRFLIERVDKNVVAYPQDKWDMFNNSQNLNATQQQASFGKLLLVPNLLNRMESEPLEKIVFLRDEMANMSWAIEDIIPNDLFGGRSGKAAVDELQTYLGVVPNSNVPYNGYNGTVATLRYKLINNNVPENWIPFVPAKDTTINYTKMVMQRASMARYTNENDTTPDRIRPRTSLLSKGITSTGSSPYYINEEELSNAGFVITTNYQRARWFDGSTHVWLGRKKQTGRGEAFSGLLYDTLVPKPQGS